MTECECTVNCSRYIKCDECKWTCIFEYIGACTFCKKTVCTECVAKNYPDWTLTGCRIKGVDEHKSNVDIYHCIYPILFNSCGQQSNPCGQQSNPCGQQSNPCGRNAYFSNICSLHFSCIEQDFKNNLRMLPDVLVNICIEYFYLRVAPVKRALIDYRYDDIDIAS